METKKRLLAILFIVYGVLQAIGMLVLSVFLSFLISFLLPEVEGDGKEINEILEWIIPFVQFIVVAVIILFSIPSIIGGIALLNGKKWALTLLLILGCFKLFSFPFGTALGIFSIWVYSENNKVQATA
jgi:uncharacterized membrane protein